MMGSRRLLTGVLATVGVLAGGLLGSTAPALAAAPSVVDQTVSSVTPSEAHLEAVVNAGEEVTECHFEYGKTSVSEHIEECEQGNALEGGEQGVGKTVTGLTPKTVYQYRLVVKNATGEVKGTGNNAEEEFTTLTLEKPIIEGQSATELTSTGAKLEATINPNYQETTCEFQYGTDASLATHTTEPCSASLGEGGNGVGTSITLAGLEVGQTYYYRVLAANGTGTTEDTIASFTTQGKPLVTTGEAQSVTQTTATFSGTVDPFGAETTYHFAYISQAGYEKALGGDAQEKADPYAEGETTTPVKLTEADGEPYKGYEAQAVGPVRVSGMLPGETYYYALVAENEVAVTIGPPESVRTLAGTPPIVSTGGASGVSQNSATLSGMVSTNSLQTEYDFEIGTEPNNYGPATGLGSIGGATTETVSVALGELQPGTTYYYRVTATNADGAGYGESETFTTPGFPTLLTAPSAPPMIATPAIAFPTESSTPKTTGTALTRTQKLAAALRTCRTKSKGKRAGCEKRARKQYAPVKAGPRKKHKVQH